MLLLAAPMLLVSASSRHVHAEAQQHAAYQHVHAAIKCTFACIQLSHSLVSKHAESLQLMRCMMFFVQTPPNCEDIHTPSAAEALALFCSVHASPLHTK